MVGRLGCPDLSGTKKKRSDRYATPCHATAESVVETRIPEEEADDDDGDDD